LLDQQLDLHFQPQVDAASGRLIGAEALIRWHDGERQIPPDVFIPVAEETGLIIPIGQWVIDRAIAQIVDWRARYGDIPPIAINLSPRQFWRPSVSPDILAKLATAGLPGSALELEVTESLLLDAASGCIEELHELRNAGLAIALDDFGTGYSSLSYLQRLPIATLKIDRSFISNLVEAETTPGSDPLVRAIIAMAHSLSLRVIAEGVETPAQLAHLQALGCDVIQGYLVSRPLPAAAFAEQFLSACPARG
jgi:EAL domain-containing protein (putative c-di-GMP-specific phosphodiesterase class I)